MSAQICCIDGAPAAGFVEAKPAPYARGRFRYWLCPAHLDALRPLSAEEFRRRLAAALAPSAMTDPPETP